MTKVVQQQQSHNDVPESREDDSANAVRVELDTTKQRLDSVEAKLKSPDELGKLVAAAAKNSTPFRKELAKIFIEMYDDYDTRKKLEGLINKVDRSMAWRALKFLGAVIIGVAAIVAAVFAILAYFK